MPWGSFGTVHLVTLAIAVVINVLLYLILETTTKAKQTLILFILSLFGAGTVIADLIINKNDILRNLPLSFWALNALLLPIAVFTRGKRISNRLLIWSVASIIALVVNTQMANVDVFSWEFAIYFTKHTLGAGIPILLFELQLTRRDTKTVKSTVFSTLIVFTAVHAINLIINSLNGWSVNDGVNYMATLSPNSALFDFFYAIIPSEYWYMVLALPALSLYILYWYLPEILDQRRRKKPLREKIDDIDEYYEEYEEEYIDEIIKKKYN